MLTRRDLLRLTGIGWMGLKTAPFLSSVMTTGSTSVTRCINVINFIRGVEPRFETDLLLPVQKQMELILSHRLPATWLLQFDALVSGQFVDFLKQHMAKDHEVGFWFEMNQMLCDAAKVNWRGRPGYEWDHLPPVAFTIGYTPEERIKLADAAMRRFKTIWGKFPSSVASWNLDSITIQHLSENYGVDAFAVCRDQIATDGFTIWGAPIAGYYPSKVNCWSPAVDRKNQIHTPIFRMLGQDPVYYYERRFKLPSGKVVSEPDTMEPTWTSGQSPKFVTEFLKMISEEPALHFAYAQLGQENSFPWQGTAEGYPLQMKALAELRDSGKVLVETMGQSGRRFKKSFAMTPAHAQVMLEDPFGNTPAQTTAWYQSRFYRANLHFRGDLPFLRDLTVYSDRNEQPFLNKATRQNDVEQRMPAILDGYHWSRHPGSMGEPTSGGFIELDGQRVQLSAKPRVKEDGNALVVAMSLQNADTVVVRFEERRIELSHEGPQKLSLSFEWDPARSAFKDVQNNRATYRWQDFDYSVKVSEGEARATDAGWAVSESKGRIVLQFGS